MTEFDPRAAAEAVSQPGTFSFIERLRGRNMPKDSVTIYLDEEAGYRLKKVNIEHSLVTDAKDPKLDELEAEMAELNERLAQSRYTFHLESIPADDYDAIIVKVREEMPGESNTTVNPLTNEVVTYDVEYPERDGVIHDRIWAAFIRAIEDPAGNRDEAINEATASVLRKNLPLAAKQRINSKIAELRMASDWMDAIQDEGFFPSP